MKLVVILCFLFTVTRCFSQDTLSLEQCIDLAIKNEKHYITENYNLTKNLLTKKIHKFSFLPSITANTGYNLSFGRKLDMFTNSFATTNVQSQNMGLSSNTLLYSGNRYFNQKKINTLNIFKTNINLETKIESVKLNVIQKYIELLKLQYSIEKAKISNENLLKFKNQQILLLKNGRLNKIDTLQTSIQIKNVSLDINKLNQEFKFKLFSLNFYCGLPLNNEFYVRQLIEICPNCKIKVNEISELELLKIEQETELITNKMAQNSILPTLSLSGNLSTGFSTNNKDYTLPNYPTKPYSDQVNANIYESFGINLSIPIYNKGEYLKNKRNAQYIEDFYNSQKEYKELEITLKKAEISQKNKSLQENILLTEEILEQKIIIYKLTEILYFEGKVSMIELEKPFNEIEELKSNLIDLKLEILSQGIYEL